ncbi:MAG: twin-arginine translocation signal domain-containing protein, partial [Thermomicrobiales bacterium]
MRVVHKLPRQPERQNRTIDSNHSTALEEECELNDLSMLLRDVAAGRISRRQFLATAGAMGVSSTFLARLAASPEFA